MQLVSDGVTIHNSVQLQISTSRREIPGTLFDCIFERLRNSNVKELFLQFCIMEFNSPRPTLSIFYNIITRENQATQFQNSKRRVPPRARARKKIMRGGHVARRVQSMGQLVLHGCAFSKHRRAARAQEKNERPHVASGGAKHFTCAASQDVSCNTIHKHYICIEIVHHKLESFRVIPEYK